MDLVRKDESRREVPFKTSVQYAASHFGLTEEDALELCHEVSSKEDFGGGIDDLFKAITKRLVADSEATDRERLRNQQASRGNATERVHIADRSGGRSSCC